MFDGGHSFRTCGFIEYNNSTVSAFWKLAGGVAVCELSASYICGGVFGCRGEPCLKENFFNFFGSIGRGDFDGGERIFFSSVYAEADNGAIGMCKDTVTVG